MSYAYHHPPVDFDDEILERIRTSVPIIYSSKQSSKTEYQKWEERMLKNGYRREFCGGFERWYAGTI